MSSPAGDDAPDQLELGPVAGVTLDLGDRGDLDGRRDRPGVPELADQGPGSRSGPGRAGPPPRAGRPGRGPPGTGGPAAAPRTGPAAGTGAPRPGRRPPAG